MYTLTIAPLSTPETLTVKAWTTVNSAKKLFLQTENHPSARPVLEAGLSYVSMDDLYAFSEDYDALNEAIADRLTEGEGDRVYAVMGSSCFTQLPVIEKYCHERTLSLQILPGVSYAAAAFPNGEPGRNVNANTLPERVDTYVPLYISEMDSRILAGEVKNKLQELYPDGWEVSLAVQQPDGSYAIKRMPLFTLDRTEGYFSSSVLFVPPLTFEMKTRFGFEDLIYVLKRLRAPDGCPWDREQTHKSLNKDLREECFELIDAINEENDAHIIEELGDVLMMVLFHTVMGEETGDYDDMDVTDGIVKKLVYRHPHVFGTVEADTVEQVLTNWDQLKRVEKDQKTYTETLKSVPKSFPALLRAQKVQKKAGKAGFDFGNAAAAFYKLPEETEELRAAMNGQGNVAREMGDVFFSAVNICRLLGLDAEDTLQAATAKFIDRFACMEQLCNNSLDGRTLEEMDRYWDVAKRQEGY